MLGHVSRGTPVLAAEREPLEQAQHDQQDRSRNAPRRIGRQKADQECAKAHQRHSDEEGVLAADQIAQPAEEQRAERTHREAGGKGQECEDEGGGWRHAGEELAGQHGR